MTAQRNGEHQGDQDQPREQAEPRRGRPRSEAAHQAVLDAAARLLDAEGCSYEELTVERIAAEAGVGKQTIYRWWKNKADVVLESLLTGRLKLDFAPVPNTGDIRADLVAWVEQAIEQKEHEDAEPMARSLVAALVNGGEETYALVESSSLWENMHLTQRFREEAAAGKLRPGVDPVAVASAIMDPFILRVITRGKQEPEWLFMHLDLVLHGALPPGE
ncbi:TetR/AcrR family transcriptional regulator [Nesterenkonia alba]|uniref:TetR/AcrR family transcriptional regulator n=1 Tax=Nesterenkonia alba TaxID=515814 RepID=UPI0003B74F52|nr:TetR/AcrR family transcriptional regulator [Nesterenkonia alba]